jgi:carbon storage regulator
MLVLTRKVGERIVIDDSIVVTVLKVEGNRVRIGIRAPETVVIQRDELMVKDRQVVAGKETSASLASA